MDGYIKLWRKITDSQVFQNEGLLKVWIWCLAKASYRERWVSIKAGKGITEVKLMPGQFIFGRQTAARKLKMKPSTAWKRLQKLKKCQNLNIESNSQYSIVTICNWEQYQAIDNCEVTAEVTAREQPRNSQGTAGEHKQEGIRKKRKRKNNDKGLTLPDWLDKDLWSEFKKMRVKQKKPLTEKGQELAIKKLSDFKNDGQDPVAIIEQSIFNCWQGLFPIKENDDPYKPKTPTVEEWGKFSKVVQSGRGLD